MEWAAPFGEGAAIAPGAQPDGCDHERTAELRGQLNLALRDADLQDRAPRADRINRCGNGRRVRPRFRVPRALGTLSRLAGFSY
jgi:hypothetical protein